MTGSLLFTYFAQTGEKSDKLFLLIHICKWSASKLVSSSFRQHKQFNSGLTQIQWLRRFHSGTFHVGHFERCLLLERCKAKLKINNNKNHRTVFNFNLFGNRNEIVIYEDATACVLSFPLVLTFDGNTCVSQYFFFGSSCRMKGAKCQNMSYAYLHDCLDIWRGHDKNHVKRIFESNSTLENHDFVDVFVLLLYYYYGVLSGNFDSSSFTGLYCPSKREWNGWDSESIGRRRTGNLLIRFTSNLPKQLLDRYLLDTC